MIVNTERNYTYNAMMDDLFELQKKYSIINTAYYGKSVMGKNLPFVRLGSGPNQVFYSSSIHANEWINSLVFMKFIEEFSEAYTNDTKIFNYSPREILEKSTLYIAPMCNPDGVDLVLGAIPEDSNYYMQAKRISESYSEIPFPAGWKSNIRGVDLNLQFPADWQRAREIKYEQGFTKPAPRDFVGYGPLTEPEALGLYNFTLRQNFRLILSYHTQGEIIFWKYLDYNPAGAEEIAGKFAEVSGYELVDTGYTDSYAGYRDWFISFYNRPGFTIETGKGVNPLPLSQFQKIYNDNLGILVLGAVV